MDTKPAERSRGLWAVLESPPIYRFLQKALGGERFRAVVADEHVRATAADRVLDVGCGPGNMLAHLPDGTRYVGFDPSHRYVEAARARYGARGRFVEATVGDFPPADADDPTIVLGLGVLHHLADGDVGRLLDLASTVLAPGGRFVAADPTVIERQHPIARLLIGNDRGQHVRTPSRTEELLRSHFPDVQVTLRHDLLRTPYTYAIVEATRPAR